MNKNIVLLIILVVAGGLFLFYSSDSNRFVFEKFKDIGSKDMVKCKVRVLNTGRLAVGGWCVSEGKCNIINSLTSQDYFY